MAAGDEVGRFPLDGARVAVVKHIDNGRAVHVRAGAVTLVLDLDGDQAAEFARLLVEPAP
ncbi:MAG: hypothetical protein GEV08_21075 [Acidimicrobiia bacterium]|nr:hypothetical protein [Acidimicrobiia bacterium]